MTALYRIYSPDGVLEYVGISDEPDRRLGEHTRAPWWPTDPAVVVESYPDRDTAFAAELHAIRTERPRRNRHGRRTCEGVRAYDGQPCERWARPESGYCHSHAGQCPEPQRLLVDVTPPPKGHP